jgi:hypothetical protein
MTKGRAALSFSFAAWEDEQQVPPMRYAPEFLALYQGMTSVVPFPAKIVGALAPAPRKIRTKFQWEKGAGAKAPLFLRFYGTTKVVP